MTKETIAELVVDMTGHEGEEDPIAGELGLPFTQTGNNGLDDEWAPALDGWTEADQAAFVAAGGLI